MLKIILFLMLLVSLSVAQIDSAVTVVDSTFMDTAIIDTTAIDSLDSLGTKRRFKIAILDLKNDDNEFASVFVEKLYKNINLVSHKQLNEKYNSLEYDLEKKWFEIAKNEKINYILFLDVKSPRVKCESTCFFFKRAEKDVSVSVKVFSVDDSALVYNGLVEATYSGSLGFSLRHI